ncbi:hypothetical protein PEC18_10150 [Paucibacter sp. O1-1]|nr:hypothetical protein [Paucibacter sp. O1-1]MDA3826203.1 hypothetical protein [Paucibacter sp. O1-1]
MIDEINVKPKDSFKKKIESKDPEEHISLAQNAGLIRHCPYPVLDDVRPDAPVYVALV